MSRLFLTLFRNNPQQGLPEAMCCKCGQWKLYSEFMWPPHNDEEARRHVWCKECKTKERYAPQPPRADRVTKGFAPKVKKCTVCQVTQPIKGFDTHKTRWIRRDGIKIEREYYNSQCKACDKKRHSEWYANTDKAKAAQYFKKLRAKQMQEPSELERLRKNRREWWRKNSKAYRDYVKYLKPLLK